MTVIYYREDDGRDENLKPYTVWMTVIYYREDDGRDEQRN